MAAATYQVGDRRPLASRRWGVSQRVAKWLAEHGATPNVISVAGMICGIMAGIALFFTSRPLAAASVFWLAGALFVQLRLLANLFDGMVAVLRQKASPVGELFNEVPDRISDAATLTGFGYAAGSNVLLGFVATCLALFLAYVRVQGKVAGGSQEFCGPMAKQQRMAAVTVASVICALVPAATAWQLPKWTLVIIIAGAVVTAIRRLHRVSRTLQNR